MVLVAPSLLSADMSALGKEVKLLEQAQADLLHFDVMDGHFVPNLTFGPMILKNLKKHTNLPFDVHLMVTNPEEFVPWYAEAGADYLTFHIEATANPNGILKSIKQRGIKAGISIKPNTSIDTLKNLKEKPDLVLVMGVEPGFGGQKFNPYTTSKIKQIKEIFSSFDTLISVDGGINVETAKLCIDAGTDILAAGTSVFKNGTYAENIRALKGELS